MGKRKKLSSLIYLIILIFSSLVYAESGGIKGTVVDSTTGEPLYGANIMLLGTSFGAASDFDGTFEIKIIPVGKYTLRCSYIGYSPKEVEIEIVENRKLEINFELVTEVLEGNTVVVTAQAVGQAAAINQQLRSNTITNVVSKDKIMEVPDANAAESVGRLPGISILREGGEGNKVSIRGLSPAYNTITIGGDKIPATDFEDRSVDLSMISQEMLAGIEVTKALTADKDADAIGGTIEFKLAEAPDGGFKYNLRMQTGYNAQRDEFGQYRGSLTLSNRFFDDKFGVMVTGNVESIQRGSDLLKVGYEMLREKTADEEFAPLSVSSVRFKYIDDVRQRMGFNILLDYKIPNGKLFFHNFFSRLDRNTTEQTRRFDPSGNYQYHYYTHNMSQIDIMTNSISGEHDIAFVSLDWRLSNSQSYSRIPFGFTVRAREQSAFDYSKLSEFRSIDEIVNAARNNVEETILYDSDFETEKALERNLAAQFNVKSPFYWGDFVSGNIKMGGKVVRLQKDRDRGLLSARLDGKAYGTDISKILEYHHTGYGTPGFNYLYSSAGKSQVSNYIDPNFSASQFLNGRYDYGFGLDGSELENALTSFINDSLYSSSTVRDIDDYETTELVSSGYAMVEMNFGPYIMFLPGIRYEKTDVSMTGRKGNVPDDFTERPLDSPPEIQDTSGSLAYENWFPMIHLRIKPTDWFDVRLAYTKTISRPRLDYMLPKVRIDGSSRRITMGNPNLEAQLSTNYDFYSSFYSNAIGLISAGAYYKGIDNLIYERTDRIILNPEEDGFEPNWKGYKLDIPENSPFKTDVYGVEFEWQLNFKWLPHPFDGLVLNLNYTHVWSSTQYPRSIVRKTILDEYPFVKNEVIDTFRVGKMIDQADDIANATLGYDIGNFSGRVSMLFQGRTLADVGDREELDGYTNDYLRWDIMLKYNFPKGVSLFFNLNNLTNTPDRSYRLNEMYSTEEEYYDWTAVLGVQAKL